MQTFACLCTIDYTQSYMGRLFPQCFSQVAINPQMGEPALYPRSHSDLLTALPSWAIDPSSYFPVNRQGFICFCHEVYLATMPTLARSLRILAE